MPVQIHMPNLDGLNLPKPLTDAIRLAFQCLQTLVEGAGSTGAPTVSDQILTSSGKALTVPSGAGTDLVMIVRQDTAGGRTFSFDSQKFSASASNIDTTGNTVSTFWFVLSGTKYVQIGEPTTGMTQ
jgi:hypothetical protein